MTNKHANFSPSGMHSRRLCPGSHQMRINYPESGDSPAATDGTHSHTLLETVLKKSLKEGRWLSAANWEGINLADHCGAFFVDQDRAARVQLAINYVAKCMNDRPGSRLLIEQRVDPGALIGRNDWFGTADIIIASDDLLEVIDYKDGKFPVWPDENDQLDSYAFGALGMLYDPPDNIKTTIIQPKDSTPIKAGTVRKFDELMSRLPEFAAVIEACDSPDAPRIPGKDQCMWCPGKTDGRCPEFVNAGSSDLNQLVTSINDSGPCLLDQVSGPDDVMMGPTIGTMAPAASQSASMPIFPEVDGSMSNEQISRVLDAVDTAKQWFKEVEAEAKRRIRLGETIPDYKAVKVNSPRKWSPDMEMSAIVKKLQGMKIKKSECTELKLVSFTQVLKHPGLTERQVNRIKDELLTKPGSGDNFKVVPAVSKGEALEFDKPDLLEGVNSAEDVRLGSDPDPDNVSFI